MSKRKKKIIRISLRLLSGLKWEWIAPSKACGAIIESKNVWKAKKTAENNAAKWFGEHFPDCKLEFRG